MHLLSCQISSCWVFVNNLFVLDCCGDQVTGPNGNQIEDHRNKISEKLQFVAHEKGVYKFCFTNRSPYHETLDFDVYVGHFTYYEQHAKDGERPPRLFVLSLLGLIDSFLPKRVEKVELVFGFESFLCASAEHLKPVLEQMGKLEEALHNIQFEQHWLEAQTERQSIGKRSSCHNNN